MGTSGIPTGRTILVADDEAMVRKMLAVTLERQGHTALLAADGLEALAVARTTSIDVILLDLQMPRLDGETFCQRYRAQGGQLPIVLMTATVGQALAEIQARCEPTGVLIKPFRLSTLLETLARVLNPTTKP